MKLQICQPWKNSNLLHIFEWDYGDSVHISFSLHIERRNLTLHNLWQILCSSNTRTWRFDSCTPLDKINSDLELQFYYLLLRSNEKFLISLITFEFDYSSLEIISRRENPGTKDTISKKNVCHQDSNWSVLEWKFISIIFHVELDYYYFFFDFLSTVFRLHHIFSNIWQSFISFAYSIGQSKHHNISSEILTLMTWSIDKHKLEICQWTTIETYSFIHLYRLCILKCPQLTWPNAWLLYKYWPKAKIKAWCLYCQHLEQTVCC